mgnify:CR=1 FL=1
MVTSDFPNAYLRDLGDGAKRRPDIDPQVYGLAVNCLESLLDGPMRLADEQQREDAEWSLASEIQNAVEDGVSDQETAGRITTRGGAGSEHPAGGTVE